MANLFPKPAVFARPSTWLLTAVSVVPLVAVAGGWMEPLLVLATYWWEYATLGLSALIQLTLVNRAELRDSLRRGVRHILVTFFGAAVGAVFITGVVLVILLGLLCEVAKGAGQASQDTDLWQGLGATWTSMLATPEVLMLAAILGVAQLVAVALDYWMGAPFDSHRAAHVHRKLFIFAVPYLAFQGAAIDLFATWPAALAIGLVLVKLWLELVERSWYIGLAQQGTENGNADHKS